MPPVHDYALIGGIAALSTYLLTFPLRWLAARISFVAAPDDRRVHSQLIPYGGGLAMFLAFVAAMIVADHIANLHGIYQGSSEPLGVVLGAAIILAVGLLDDAHEISAPAKVAGQVLAAMVLVFLGATMFWLKVPLAGTVVLSSDVTPLLTALWVIGITNAINLIDGLDGLAAGIVAIASGALAVYGLRLVQLGLLQPTNLGPLIAVITCGVCIGFLPHNFNPAKVFMGDAGALFLGLLMAAATMEIGGRTEGVTGQTYFFYAPLFLPLFILGVPIADMAFAYIRRAVKGTPIDTPDKDHVHHRLVRLGHGPRRTVAHLVDLDGGTFRFRAVPPVRARVQRHHPLRCHRARSRALHLVPPGPATGSPQTAYPRRQRGRRGSSCGNRRGGDRGRDTPRRRFCQRGRIDQRGCAGQRDRAGKPGRAGQRRRAAQRGRSGQRDGGRSTHSA